MRQACGGTCPPFLAAQPRDVVDVWVKVGKRERSAARLNRLYV